MRKGKGMGEEGRRETETTCMEARIGLVCESRSCSVRGELAAAYDRRVGVE